MALDVLAEMAAGAPCPLERVKGFPAHAAIGVVLAVPEDDVQGLAGRIVADSVQVAADQRIKLNFTCAHGSGGNFASIDSKWVMRSP